MSSSTPEFCVRDATENDIPALIELRKLLLDVGDGHYVANTPEERLAWQHSYRSWLINNLSQNPKIKVMVISPTTSPSIVACGIGIIDERVPFNGCHNGRMGWVQTMVVHPDFRRLGLGERIIEALSVWFKANEVQRVALQTTCMAADFYKSLNFSDSGEALLIKSLS